MTIDEAIRELEQLPLPLKTGGDHERHLAVRIGIEALKRVKAQRGPGGEIGALGLPGETEG